MKPRWLESLFALISFLWVIFSKLPGLSTGEPGVAPSRTFECKRKGKWKKHLELRTKGVEFTWLSESNRGIAMQRVKYHNGSYHALEKVPAKSRVKIKMVSNKVAKLYNLTPKIKKRLLSGRGLFALVTSHLNGNVLHKDKEMIVEGDGRGAWKIQKADWEKNLLG